MIVGGHCLDLYCRNADPTTGTGECDTNGRSWGGHAPHSFGGPTAAHCRQQARREGWAFGRDGDVTCPTCTRKRRRALAAQEKETGP